jgi:hypothetical protein
MVIEPPYVGVPSESHQFPVVVVVVGMVEVAVAIVGVVMLVVIVVVVDISVDAVVDVAQDASNIAVNSKTLKPNQINFLFNSYSFFTPALLFSVMASIIILVRQFNTFWWTEHMT